MDTAVSAPIREVTPRVHAAVRAGAGDLAPSTMRIPNAHYADPAAHRQRRDRLTPATPGPTRSHQRADIAGPRATTTRPTEQRREG
jgi:hypothetical protein